MSYMVLRSARPMHRRGTSSAQFMRRIPTDLKEVAKGKSVRITLPPRSPHEAPDEVFPKAGPHHIQFSLRVPCSHPAYERRFAAANEQVLAWFEALRRGPRKLTHKELEAVAGEAYRAFAETLEDDPILSAMEWGQIAAAQLDELQRNPLLIGEDAVQQELDARLEKRYGLLADGVLRRLCLVVTDEDRREIIRRISRDAPEAAMKLARNAAGDFGQDVYAQRFPAVATVQQKSRSPEEKPSVSWDALLSNWRKVRSPGEKTAHEWNRIVRSFAGFCGKQDAAAVNRDDVRRWRDHLRQERGLSLKGINDTHLAALKAVFNAAMREGLLNENPAAHTTLATKATPKNRMKGFTDSEAAQILRAAINEAKPLFRWAPWLIAQSGARAGEICQLHAEDFEVEGDQHFFWIRHEVKTGEARRVPLHSDLIRQGVLDFVRARAKGPLFFDPKKRKGKWPHKVLVKDLGRWARTTGVALGREKHRKDPNHGWRHWLVTQLRLHETPEYVIKAIVGHSGGSVTAGYGETPLVRMAKALENVRLKDLLKDQ